MPFLVRDLKARGLWDEVMVSDLKYFDGALGPIDRVPEELKALYATAFEIDAHWLVEAAARRQKWIDQAQSLNLYLADAQRAEARRTLPACLGAGLEDHLLPAHAICDPRREIDVERYRRQAQRGLGDGMLSAPEDVERPPVLACRIDDPTCEACQ